MGNDPHANEYHIKFHDGARFYSGSAMEFMARAEEELGIAKITLGLG